VATRAAVIPIHRNRVVITLSEPGRASISVHSEATGHSEGFKYVLYLDR
jgi:hypothetical protein